MIQIKKLIKKYFYHYEEADYAHYMIRKTKGLKKTEYEEEYEYHSYVCDDIANQIMLSQPSKYMLKKYPEIEDILNQL